MTREAFVPGIPVGGSQWQLLDSPAVGVRAFKTRELPPQAETRRQVCTFVTFSLATDNTGPISAGTVVVEILDGPPGSERLWAAVMAISSMTNQNRLINAQVQVLGSLNTEMTIGFAVSMGIGVFEVCSAQGYIVETEGWN